MAYRNKKYHGPCLLHSSVNWRCSHCRSLHQLSLKRSDLTNRGITPKHTSSGEYAKAYGLPKLNWPTPQQLLSKA